MADQLDIPKYFSDPRSSSTHSLHPIESDHNRRKLLVIYIHGFLGDESTFKSFPAHVHNILTAALASTHTVYTKLYPRYKSRKHISFAANDFSKWLSIHESPQTDVILIGHSLGGILAAEVVLLPSQFPQDQSFFRHRILGLISFDTPFLGLHPRVVKTGLASLFKSTPELDSSIDSNSSIDPTFTPSTDPNFNPSYINDAPLAKRKGKTERALYFWNKHYGDLLEATDTYIRSHLEFGGCLADWSGLIKRYDAIRSLEDLNENSKPVPPDGKLMNRVRFANYYSASGPSKQITKLPIRDSVQSEASSSTLPEGNTNVEDVPRVADLNSDGIAELEKLPSIAIPEQPQPFDAAKYQNKDILKIAQKEYDRQMKAYQQAEKDRRKSMTEREKLKQKLEKDSGKVEKGTNTQLVSKPSNEVEEKIRDWKFCNLPKKDPQTGKRDPVWVRIHMEGLDEVTAHMSMFDMSETYTNMVGDVISRIEEWVHEDGSNRQLSQS